MSSSIDPRPGSRSPDVGVRHAPARRRCPRRRSGAGAPCGTARRGPAPGAAATAGTHPALELELASGSLKRLSADIPWDIGGGSISHDGRWLAHTANVDGRQELRLVDRGQPRGLPTLPGGSVTRIDFHPARDELALVVDSVQGPAQVHSLEPATGTVLAWTRPTAEPSLNLAALPEQPIVRWKSFDGRTISGVLTLPPARFGGRRPVLLSMHGGPEAQARQGWQGRTNHLVQELGVAVLEPNVRGSSGYGKTFLSLDNSRLREDSVKDMASAIDWIATQAGLDATRVVVAGGSYGGYMALADNEGHGFARRENADFYFAALVTFIEQTLLR